MSERRELGIGGGAAECARRSGAGQASCSRTRNSGPVPGLYVQPSRLLGAGDKGAPGTVRNPRGRTRDQDPGSGETVTPANAVPGGLALPAAQPATGPGELPEPGRRVSSARRTASSRAKEPPPAGMPPPAHARSRRPGASRCPSFGRSHGPGAGGSPQLFTPPCLPQGKAGHSGS